MREGNIHIERYASVILPVRYSGEISYFLPKIFDEKIGQRVKVDFAGKIYSGVIKNFLSNAEIPTHTPDGKEIQYKPILAIEEAPAILPTEIALWERVAKYYMCTTGEVYKAAYPSLQVKQENVKPRKRVEHFLEAVAEDSISKAWSGNMQGADPHTGNSAENSRNSGNKNCSN